MLKLNNERQHSPFCKKKKKKDLDAAGNEARKQKIFSYLTEIQN